METVHIVPSFHYDLAYLETVEGYLPKAFECIHAMLDLCKASAEYTFVLEQVALIEAYVTRFPDELPVFKQLAQQGRLEAGTGMYVMPDANMPGVESLIRQAITGQRWLRSRLGVTATVCWLADCWGHPATLPGILHHCGYRAYMFWRGKTLGLTVSEFRWRGLDGSELLCHWTPFGYGAIRFPEGSGTANALDQQLLPVAELRNLVSQAKSYAQTTHLLLPTSGDLAMPQATTMPGIAALNRQASGAEHYQASTPSRFFAAVEATGVVLPVIEGEFNPVFQGTYSSRIGMKQLNRRLESALGSAEKASVLLWQDGAEYPAAQLDDVRRVLLRNQQHDIISGTIIDAAYEEAIGQHRAADGAATRLLMDAIDRAMARRTSRHGGMSIFAFNPLPRPRHDVLRINTMAIGWSAYRVSDAQGHTVPAQWSGNELVFEVDVPPLGYAVYGMHTAADQPAPRAVGPAPTVIDTDHYHLRIENGVITSLRDRTTGHEHVDPQRPFWNDLVLQYDSGDLWLLYTAPLNGSVRTTTPLNDPYPGPPSDDDPVFRAGICSHTVPVHTELLESGSVRTVLRSRGTLRYWATHVEFTQFVTVYQHLRRIDFRTELEGHGKHYRVRVAFPSAVRRGRIVHSVPGGQIERPEGEYPGQSWLRYGDGASALCVINRGLPGGNVTDGVVLLSLMRSTAMEYKGASSKAFEEGVRHSSSYSVIPGEVDAPWWEAEAFNNPPLAMAAADVPPGLEPRLGIEPASVVLTALYLDGGVLTARLHEAAGQRCEALLWMRGLQACQVTDAMELEGQPLPVESNTVRLAMGPFQIMTLRLQVERSQQAEAQAGLLKHAPPRRR